MITLNEVKTAIAAFEAHPYPMSTEHARLRDIANAAIDRYAAQNQMSDVEVIAAVKHA